MRPPPIVAGFNPRTGAREPVELGLAAGRRLGAPLKIVAVVPDRAVTAAGGREAGALDALRADLRRRRAAAKLEVVEAVTAGSGLIAAVERLDPLFVALGTTARGGATAAILGTTVERVIHAHVCPVAVVPHGYRAPPARTLVIGAAFAPTAEGREALETAAALARASAARLRIVTVLASAPRPRAGGTLPTAADRLAQAAAQLGDDLDVELNVRDGDAAGGLLAAAAGLDLLVLGSRADAARRGMVLGSVSRHVTERASCPVLVLPRGAADAMGALRARGASLPAAWPAIAAGGQPPQSASEWRSRPPYASSP
jgi:nucleotide-binding universal stress UspA family protein